MENIEYCKKAIEQTCDYLQAKWGWKVVIDYNTGCYIKVTCKGVTIRLYPDKIRVRNKRTGASEKHKLTSIGRALASFKYEVAINEQLKTKNK